MSNPPKHMAQADQMLWRDKPARRVAVIDTPLPMRSSLFQDRCAHLKTTGCDFRIIHGKVAGTGVPTWAGRLCARLCIRQFVLQFTAENCLVSLANRTSLASEPSESVRLSQLHSDPTRTLSRVAPSSRPTSACMIRRRVGAGDKPLQSIVFDTCMSRSPCLASRCCGKPAMTIT